MQGLIVSNISNLYQVEVENDEIVECKVRGKLKQGDISPVVGDYVEIEILENEDGKGVINSIEERKMYSKRPKLANLTQMILVVSLKSPKPDLLLLDKQLVYSEYLNIKPIICINKIDLGKKEIADEIHNVYEKIGYTVIETNAKEGIGVEDLKNILKGHITAFSGNSGVGKSTLINSILGEVKTLEGEVSLRINRGKNTTTSATLYKINDGYVADTPGFSTFEIVEVESEELAKYFREFKEHISDCEYLDCEHIKEEKCGIKKAIEDYKIDIGRYQRYCKIQEELKEKEAHKW